MTTNQTKREPQAIARTRIKRKKPQVNVLFERGEGAKQRLPSRRQMTFWGKDYATNVLTFDYEHEPVAVADIVVCLEVVQHEAKEQFKRFAAHLAHLLVHGALHAQGWDHETDEEAELMEQKEREIMNELGFDDPYYDAARGH